MILEDSAAAIAPLSSRTFDVCVIGSGALGIAFGMEMAKAGKEVLMLEAGRDDISDESQDFYRYSNGERPHGDQGGTRYRVYGGSTERWGGQAMYFEKADFTPRHWMGSPGWPVDYEELAPYYQRAEKVMGLERPPYDELEEPFYRTARRLGMDPAALREGLAPFKLHYSAFSKTPRLREHHRAFLEQAPRLHIVKNSAAVRLETDGQGEGRGLHLRTGDREHRIAARLYILATGGIENARFLLLQRDYFHLPELQPHRMIGRCFQDHPGAHVAEVHGPIAALAQNVFRLQRTDAVDLKARLSWSEETRMEQQRMAVSGTFLMDRHPSPYDTAPTGMDWLGGGFQTLKSLARGLVYSPLHRTVLAVSAEDVRDLESRITLDPDAKDAWGLPRAKMHWKVAPQVAESILAYVDTVEQLIQTQRLGRLRRFPCAKDAASLLPALKDNAHHIGATSMGRDLKEGVVDASLGVFGLRNLKVIGTSVLPTGSHANPTLTALALCYRLVDQCKSRSP